MSRLSPEQFDKALQGSRLSARSRDLARAILVDGVGPSQAADAAGMARQQAHQVKESVLARHSAIAHPEGSVKVSAQEFLHATEHRDTLLRAFRAELLKLARAGYPVAVMVQYLKANSITATPAEIQRVLGPLRRSKVPDVPQAPARRITAKVAQREDSRSRQPKGRRRKDG